MGHCWNQVQKWTTKKVEHDNTSGVLGANGFKCERSYFRIRDRILPHLARAFGHTCQTIMLSEPVFHKPTTFLGGTVHQQSPIQILSTPKHELATCVFIILRHDGPISEYRWPPTSFWPFCITAGTCLINKVFV